MFDEGWRRPSERCWQKWVKNEQLCERVQNLEKWLPTTYLKPLPKSMLLRNSPLNKSRKYWTERFMGLMKCSRAPYQNNTLALVRGSSSPNHMSLRIAIPHARFSMFLVFYILLVTEVVNISFSWWCWKALGYPSNELGAITDPIYTPGSVRAFHLWENQ